MRIHELRNKLKEKIKYDYQAALRYHPENIPIQTNYHQLYLPQRNSYSPIRSRRQLRQLTPTKKISIDKQLYFGKRQNATPYRQMHHQILIEEADSPSKEIFQNLQQIPSSEIQNNMIELDYSGIEFKSPTYSDIFSSNNSQQTNLRENKQKIQKHLPFSKCQHQKRNTHEVNQRKQDKYDKRVGFKKNAKMTQMQRIRRQLQQIYEGKFKINRT